MPNNPNASTNLKPFQPGQSGNPAGKPKGTRNRSTIVQKWLDAEEVIRNPITKQVETLTQEDIITLMQISQARKGNTHAYKALQDSAYGRPAMTIEHTGEGGGPIQTEDLSKLSTDELLLRRAALRARIADERAGQANV